MAEQKTPIEREGWDSWRNEHLKFDKKELPDKTGFDDFCSRLKLLLDDFAPRYKEVLQKETEKKKTDRQRGVGRDLERLHKALKTAKERGLFKDHAPDFFISLLMLCCETEHNHKYVKGTQNPSKCLAEFIAQVANLIHECTGYVFHYNSKADLLCSTVCECLEGISENMGPSAVRDCINTYIRVSACDRSELVAYKDFTNSELTSVGKTPGDLPGNFVFEGAVATHNPMNTVSTRKKGFRYSFLAGHLMLDKYPGAGVLQVEEILHPDISLWFRHLMHECVKLRNKRAICVFEEFRKLVEEFPQEINYTTPCCADLVSAFNRKGECYSPDDMLALIHGSLQFVCRDDSEGEKPVVVCYEYAEDTHYALKLPCNPLYITEIKPYIIDFIPEERPSSLHSEICCDSQSTSA